jgi:hypothetical protein
VRDRPPIVRLPTALPSTTTPKTTRTYWNPLSDEHRGDWQPIEGLEGMAEELTLAIDEASGDYTRHGRALMRNFRRDRPITNHAPQTMAVLRNRFG